MSDKKLSIIEKIKNNKNLQRIIIALLSAIVFVIFIYSTFSSNKKVENEVNTQETYVSQLENRLSNALSSVEGAGKVSVVITVESGMETVLAMKTTTTQTSNGLEVVETPILVNGKTVVLKENYPKVIGVMIVCEGAKSLSVLSKIQQATVSLLNINANQIEILTMK